MTFRRCLTSCPRRYGRGYNAFPPRRSPDTSSTLIAEQRVQVFRCLLFAGPHYDGVVLRSGRASLDDFNKTGELLLRACSAKTQRRGYGLGASFTSEPS